MTDNSLLEDFTEETREHLEELENSLLSLESDPANRELLDTIFRSMHTIKGASDYLGFERIARLSHRLENLLDLFRDGSLQVDKVAADLLIDARDRIGDLIGQIEASGREASEIDDLVDRAAALADGSRPAEEASTAKTVYEGEADTELFDIFIEQLAEGLGGLLEAAGRIAAAVDVSAAAAEIAEAVERLSATANYMGYDALWAVYEDMLTEIGSFSSQSETAGAQAYESFLQSVVVSGVKRIRSLFPNARSLENIDTRISHPVPDDGSTVQDSREAADDSKKPSTENVLDDDLDLDATLCLDLDEDPIEDEAHDPAEDLDLGDGLSLEEAETDETPLLQEGSDHSLFEDFTEETREHLEELETSLLSLESDPANRELLDTIFRSMHTIKGASDYLGFERIARLSHRLENLLDLFRDGSLRVDKVAVDLLIDARDRIGDLIEQIEASGREASEIDDLVDRAAALTDGSRPAEEASTEKAAYEGEADTELFDIFMEQLAEGLGDLLEAAGRFTAAADVSAAAGEIAEAVERLLATANYMGYDALSTVYEDMLAEIGSFSSRSETADAQARESFLQSVVVSGVERIRSLFPNAGSLARIDMSAISAVSGDTASTQQATEPQTPPPSEFANLLASLPAMDEIERESLLSKTLDETFSSMRSGEEDDDVGAAGTDPDPIALQFSSALPEVETVPAPAGTNGENDDVSSILDDFGTPLMQTPAPFPGDPAEVEPYRLSADDGEGEVDFWPRAAAAEPPAPAAPAEEVRLPRPQIDLSTPPTQTEKIAGEGAPESSGERSAVRRSIRVDAEKVDDLMDQVGELVVNRSSFTQLFQEMRTLTQYLNERFSMDKAEQRMVSGLATRLSEATTVLGRVTNELQEQVMKVRMLPISRLFNRYPRLVHDLLRDSDKKVQLQFRGEETELDRMVIEQLADPMIHIIRNAVDHGIENRDLRRQKGKSQGGVLLLEAYHEGGNVIIEVTDDGKGIDLARIRQKALDKQLVDRDTVEQMDHQALIDLIMLPGFSTSDEVTHTSGRGVGMDVVKRNIEKINGSIVVDTRQDVGTRIRIKIPLTLAIIQALMIRSGGSHFTVPLSAVQETLRIDRGEIFTVDGSEVMHLHEEPLPLIRLTDLLNMPERGGVAAPVDRLFVVVVKSATGRTGLIVDALLGRQEVVIKPLEDYLQEGSGFSGATILGDGGISLILDVDELLAMAKDKQAEKKLTAAVL
jgi:two-component system chemotaxis sensor kinase CheA